MPQKTPRKTRATQSFPLHRCSTPLAVDCKRFLDWSLAHGYSEATIKSFSRFLVLFCLWCEERELCRAHEISLPILERYQRHLFGKRKADGEPLTLKSQAVQLWCLRSFFRWMHKQQLLSQNPAAELAPPKFGKPLPRKILSVEQMELLLEQPDLKTPTGLRDRAILEVFYATGIRRSELVGLKLEDVELDARKLMVRKAKNGRQRLLPLGVRAAGWLRLYLGSARPQLARSSQEPWLFLTLLGQSIRPVKLGEIVKTHLKKAGIEGPGSCHILRHTCATLMLDNGADIRIIQELLGHEELSSTQLYTRVSIGKLEQVHAATHPLERSSAPAEDRQAPGAHLLHGGGHPANAGSLPPPREQASGNPRKAAPATEVTLPQAPEAHLLHGGGHPASPGSLLPPRK